MDPNEQRPVLDITVFILSYNRPRYLREMLSSVLSQTVLPEEIVILDNGSDNGTKEAVKDLIEGRVRWIGTEYNHQSLWNFKRAFSMSERKYFTILHDDDRLLPKFLETTVDALEMDNGLIAVTSNGYRIDDQGIRTPLKLLPGATEKILYFQNSEEAALRYSYGYMPFPNMVYRNGFPQRTSIKEEFGKVWDSVFIIDLAGLGKIAILNDPLFEYRHHSGQDSSIFPEDLLQLKEEYILKSTEGSNLHSKITRNVVHRQSRRFSGLIINSLLKRRDPRHFFDQAGKFAYEHANVPCVMYYLIFDRMIWHREKKALSFSEDDS